MSARALRLPYRILAVWAFILLETLLNGQQPKVLAPHKPIASRVPKELERHELGTLRSMVGGLWMIDANRKASIYLKNGVETSSIEVRPSIYLSNGTRFVLAPVTLEAGGTAVVSINDALREKGIAPWAQLSGYIEVEYTWAWDPLCVTVTNVDPVHSVIFSYGVQPAQVAQVTNLPMRMPKVMAGMNSVDGMWWKAEANVGGFVALSNTSIAPTEARIEVTDSENKPLGEHSVRVSAHGTKIVKLAELQGAAAGSAGGMRVMYSGAGDAMLVNGGLEDQTSGYSANLPFHVLAAPEAKQTSRETYSELGLMSGAADPVLSFPADTVFRPFSVVRNVGDGAVAVTPTLYWMQGAAAHSAALPSFTLSSMQARNLDVPALLAHAGLGTFNGSVNLILEAEGNPRSLLLASGSVDRRNTYVFQVFPRGVQESQGKAISYWSTAKGDDTMVTLWNPADESQDYIFSLAFVGGHYRLPVHLEARATRMFNISEIIANQIPDDEGNVIPPTVKEGSARVAGSHADNEEILVAVDVATYNVRKATCTYYCISCDGEVLAFVDSPFAIAKGGTKQLTFYAKDNRGYQYSIGGGTWSTSNSAVAAVGSSTGMATGVLPGGVTMSAYTNNIAVYNSYYCQYDPYCPYNGYASGGGGGNVLQVTNVSPSPLVLGTSGTLTISGQGFASLLSPAVLFDASSGISTGIPIVGSDSQMTVSYQVTCAAFTTLQNLQIGSSADGGINGVPWVENVVLPSPPGATIKLGANTISGTQPVVVGQQMALSASVSLPACTSISSQQWTTTGAPVGGYSPSSTSGSVTPLPPSTGSTYKFYWAYPSNGKNATYQYTMSGGGSSVSSPVATVTFNVAGPAVSAISTPTGNVGIFAGPVLGFGPTGIKFTPTLTTPSGDSGQFKWVQLITNDTSTLTTTSGTVKSCVPVTTPASSSGTGLDTAYPYATGTSTSDSPSGALSSSTYKKVARSFTAQMYLLWDPVLPAGCTGGGCTSIPIPLGAVSWGWSGTASYSSPNWSLTASSKTTPSWVPSSSSYPTWSDLVPYSGQVLCH